MAFDPKQKMDTKLIPDNIYLKEPAKGLKLIASLVAAGAPAPEDAVDRILDGMISSCGILKLEHINEGEAKRGPLQEIRSLVERLKSPMRRKLFSRLTKIGFGGEFSSGKSSVINSLILSSNKENGQADSLCKLPISQSPSTSIPTYVLDGPCERIIACTKTGNEIILDTTEALDALSHKFAEKYKLNPAQFLDFMAVTLPNFPVKNMALVDTPGFDKEKDNAKNLEQRTDKKISSAELVHMDHLVWVIGFTDKVALTSTSKDFIDTMNIPGKIIIILNKCDVSTIYNDKNPEDNAIIANLGQQFKDKGIPYHKIIPYVSKEKARSEWHYNCARVLKNTLNEISMGYDDRDDEISQIKQYIDIIEEQFTTLESIKYKDDIAEIDRHKDRTLNAFNIAPLIRMRGVMELERQNITNNLSSFRYYSQKLLNWCREQA